MLGKGVHFCKCNQSLAVIQGSLCTYTCNTGEKLILYFAKVLLIHTILYLALTVKSPLNFLPVEVG